MLTCVYVTLTWFVTGFISMPPMTKSNTRTSSWNHGDEQDCYVNCVYVTLTWFATGFISIPPMTMSNTSTRSWNHGDEHDCYVNLCVSDTHLVCDGILFNSSYDQE